MNGRAQTKHEWNGHGYYSLDGQTLSEAKKMVVFLHGGLKNPLFKTNDKITLDYLIEENEYFLELIKEKEYGLIVPLTDNKLNWVENTEYCYLYLKTLISEKAGEKKVLITGFSDGGTGAYRMFYEHPDYFEGAVIFNGYPQRNNYHDSVNYKSVTDKNIVFASTTKDKQIPYEFLMTEYAQQKQFNGSTYFIVNEGKHTFSAYDLKALNTIFDLLNQKPGVDKIMQEPLHGLVYNDSLHYLYKYRPSVVRKYYYGKSFCLRNKIQIKELKKKGFKSQKMALKDLN